MKNIKLFTILSLLVATQTCAFAAKYRCSYYTYTPGQTASQYCSIYSGVKDSTGEDIYDVCMKQWYPEAKSLYNQGKCKRLTIEKYTDECGSKCTKEYVKGESGYLETSCTGGDADCRYKLFEKRAEQMLHNLYKNLPD